MNNIKLRDCPCCGQLAEICQHKDFLTGTVTAYIQCTNCGIQTKEVKLSIMIGEECPPYNPIEVLVKCWNQRVKDDVNNE